MISEAILTSNIYARLQEIASNFSKFSGGGPPDPPLTLGLRRSIRDFAPLPGPLSKIPGSAPGIALSATATRTCPEGYSKCYGSRQCVLSYYFNDSENDCNVGTDELEQYLGMFGKLNMCVETGLYLGWDPTGRGPTNDLLILKHGLRGAALDWFRSYLSGRTYRVIHGGKT